VLTGPCNLPLNTACLRSRWSTGIKLTRLQVNGAVHGETGAQPFGGQISRCEQADGYGNCVKYLVTVMFQCTGTPAASR
jgi:hypothetical protein